MTQLERIKVRIHEEPNDGLLEEVLESAKNVILSRRYPFGDWPVKIVETIDGRLEEIITLEPRYMDLQLRMAIDLYNRIGAEGQVSHSENGISRSWGAEWISQELLNEVVPMVGVVG